MIEASMAQTLEKLVITLSYSDQPFASLLAAVFCGNRRLWIFFSFVLDLFFRPVTFLA
jgi:hypothetical protein